VQEKEEPAVPAAEQAADAAMASAGRGHTVLDAIQSGGGNLRWWRFVKEVTAVRARPRRVGFVCPRS
jgi:hypothetical protein